jgi:hypothetical protein
VRSNLRFGAPGLGPKAWYARAVQEQARSGRERRHRGFAMAGRPRVQQQNAGIRRPDDMSRHSLWELAQKNQEAKVALTEGLGQAGTRRRVIVDDGQAAEAIGARGEGRRRGAPRCWAPWIASGGSCGGAAWVKKACSPPAASNCGGGSAHLGGLRGKFRPKSRPGSPEISGGQCAGRRKERRGKGRR